MEDDDVIVLDQPSVEIVDLSGPSFGDDFVPLPPAPARGGRGRAGRVSGVPRGRSSTGRGRGARGAGVSADRGGAARGRGGAARGRGATRGGTPSSSTRGRGRGASNSTRGAANSRGSPRGGSSTRGRGRGRGLKANNTSRDGEGTSERGAKSQRGRKRKSSACGSASKNGEVAIPTAPKAKRGRRVVVLSAAETRSTEIAVVNAATADSTDDVQDLNTSVQIIDQPPESTLIADKLQLPADVVANVVRLLREDNTVPFLARYRRDQVGHLPPDKLNEIRCTLNKVKVLQNRQSTAINSLASRNSLTPALQEAIVKTKTLAELEAVVEPHKTKKTDKAEAAKRMGLETCTIEMLEGKCVLLDVLQNEEGPIPRAHAEAGISDLAAEMFAKDPVVLDQIRPHVRAWVKVAGTKALQTAGPKPKQLYSQFVGCNRTFDAIPVHQLLAIIRGEREKFLKVSVEIQDSLKLCFESSIRGRWRSCRWNEYEKIMRAAVDSSYSTYVVPLMKRESRAKALERCEDVAVKDFTENLKHLLLTPPIKGSSILGVDPGFTHGCKIAVVSPTGSVLDTFVIKPVFGGPTPEKDPAAVSLGQAVFHHSCLIFAVGNGSGSRDFHSWLQRLIVGRFFEPYDIRVLSISESGASIYSCSKEAAKEFPGMDCNLISAVSLARRVLDPLSELVKVEPKHLGIGMYQHDMSSGVLEDALDSVAVMCMSEVGADLNTASVAILQRIAGIGPSKAKAIVDFREKHGPFVNRTQLLLVKDIGPKMFKQCCGFLRILPMSAQRTAPMEVDSRTLANGRSKARLCKALDMHIELSMDPDPLDMTMVHLESYRSAYRLLEKAGVSLEDIGTQKAVDAIRAFSVSSPTPALVAQISCPGAVYESLLDALVHPADYDCRNARELPPGFGAVKRVQDIREGILIVGRVTNVVQFGAFVDLGVGHDGLIHRSNIGRDVESQLVLGAFAEFRVVGFKCIGESYRIGLNFIRFV